MTFDLNRLLEPWFVGFIIGMLLGYWIGFTNEKPPQR